MDSGPTSWFSHSRSAFCNLLLGSRTPVRRGGSFKLQKQNRPRDPLHQSANTLEQQVGSFVFFPYFTSFCKPDLCFTYSIFQKRKYSWRAGKKQLLFIRDFIKNFWFCWCGKKSWNHVFLRHVWKTALSPITHSQFVFLTQRQRLQLCHNTKELLFSYSAE